MIIKKNIFCGMSIISSLAPYILLFISLRFNLNFFLEKPSFMFGIAFIVWIFFTLFAFVLNKYNRKLLFLLLLFPIAAGPFLFFAYMWIMWSLGGTPAP